MITVNAVLGEWQELIRISSRTAVPNEEGGGIPELRNFRLLGTKLFPLPEARTEDMALRVFYYARDEDPTGDADMENGWMREFPDLLIAEVGLRLAQDLEDSGAVRYFSEMRIEARKAYDNKVAEERHSTEILSF